MYCRYCGKHTLENVTVCDECARKGRADGGRTQPCAERRTYDETYSLLPALISLIGGIVISSAISYYLVIYLVYLITMLSDVKSHIILVQFITITVICCVIAVTSFIFGILGLARRNGTAKKYGSHRIATIVLSIIGIILCSFCIYYLIYTGVILQIYYITV